MLKSWNQQIFLVLYVSGEGKWGQVTLAFLALPLRWTVMPFTCGKFVGGEHTNLFLAFSWGCSEGHWMHRTRIRKGRFTIYFHIIAILFDQEIIKHVTFPSLLILLETTSERSLDEVLCDRLTDIKSLNATSGGHGQLNWAQRELTGVWKASCAQPLFQPFLLPFLSLFFPPFISGISSGLRIFSWMVTFWNLKWCFQLISISALGLLLEGHELEALDLSLALFSQPEFGKGQHCFHS